MAEAAAAIGAAGAGAGDPGAAGAAGGAGDGGWTAPDWAKDFSPELLPTLQAKAWKTPADIATQYINAEKLIGRDPSTILALPKEGDAAAWGQVYDKLGRPADASKYEFEMPATGGDEKLATWAKGVFHKLGLNGAQAKEFSQEWNKYVAAANGEMTTADELKLAEDKAALHKMWGAEESPSFKEAIAVAKAGAEKFGVNGEQLDAIQKVMGLTATLKLFNDIGAKLGEPGFAGGSGGDNGFNAMTPERAAQELKTYQSEPDNMKAWQDNRHPRHKEVMDHMTRLFQAAFPEPA